MKITIYLSAILTSLVMSNLNAFAHTTRSRELCGIIESIDQGQRTLTIKGSESGRPREFLIRKDTRFLTNWQRADSGVLTENKTACVYYRSPLFGKPFITKVVVMRTE